MAYPDYLRLRARELRIEKRLTLDEIVERLVRPRTTIYEWIKDIPLGKPRSTAGQAKRVAAMQDLDALRSYWGETLGIDGPLITVLRKSNSNKLKGRSWRSEFGVLTVRTSDTYLRARLQAWVDLIKRGWG